MMGLLSSIATEILEQLSNDQDLRGAIIVS